MREVLERSRALIKGCFSNSVKESRERAEGRTRIVWRRKTWKREGAQKANESKGKVANLFCIYGLRPRKRESYFG